ncbi:MAG: 50S ribosomal protein L29 [Candidatus Omnitrophica bacterium]|nr:50S ribosomal protein L29 [Candidatus Omnitrophota bacterium]MBU2251309.1 50S ribosomal protein L29 [Candidatus Omnitrophota bacterium]
MKLKDLQGLSKEELKTKLNELDKQLMELGFKRRSGVEKPHRFKQLKKDIARIHTVINQRTRS